MSAVPQDFEMAKKRSAARRQPHRQRPRSTLVRSPAEGRWTVEHLSGAPVGPDVVTPSVAEVLAAVDALPADLDWSVLAERIVPVFPRVRPHPAPFPDPLRVIVPPGVTVGFGIDMGAAFVAVTRVLMVTWGLTEADLLAKSLSNLKRRAGAVSPVDVVRQAVDDVPVMLLQSGAGSGSTFVLLPEELHRLFGPEPKLLTAPMRDLLIALPIDADRMLAAELFDLFASQDPNCLAPIGYLLRSGRVTIDELVPGFGLAPLAPSPSQPIH